MRQKPQAARIWPHRKNKKSFKISDFRRACRLELSCVVNLHTFLQVGNTPTKTTSVVTQV